jgi:octaprenyl-diphosphate synthase
LIHQRYRRYRQRVAYFDFLRETGPPVDGYILSFLGRHFALSPETRELLATRYRFGQPQLRPAIVRLAFHLVSGADWQAVVPLCAAVQVRETAYYCIDDVLDRGASSQLVLPGLGLYSVSYAMACEAIGHRDGAHAARILAELCQLDENTLQGTVLDAAMHGTDADHYRRKVAGYNFWEQALRIGALCGGASDETVELLGRIGKQIGMAHILANDAYDIAKDGEDFRHGKSTLPILYAFAHASADDRSQLEVLFGRGTLSRDDAVTVATIMLRCGAIDYCTGEAVKLCESAIELLHQLPDSTERGLVEFSTTYVTRNRYFQALHKLQ